MHLYMIKNDMEMFAGSSVSSLGWLNYRLERGWEAELHDMVWINC